MKLFQRQQAAFDQKPSYRASASDWLRGHGHVHRLATHRFLCELDSYRKELANAKASEAVPTAWLLPFREDFRHVIRKSDHTAIRIYFSECPREMEPICVWLLGKCANRFQLYEVKHYRHDPSPKIRRHVAKALRRLEAWELLREMANADPNDARIQWYATAPTANRPFSERLKDFASSADDSHADEVSTPSQMPFWALERDWKRSPPKSVLFMRRMLRRIRHWVRWGVT
ncbi:MAG: hypothetical protein WD468_04850 [Pirellulales bacterium]